MKKHGMKHSYNKQVKGGSVESVARATTSPYKSIDPVKIGRTGGSKTHNPGSHSKY